MNMKQSITKRKWLQQNVSKMVSIPTKVVPNPDSCFTNSGSLGTIRSHARKWKRLCTLLLTLEKKKHSNIQMTICQAFYASKWLIHKIIFSKQVNIVKKI